jgi:PTH2 family peptidyl-tRNA hydrolase
MDYKQVILIRMDIDMSCGKKCVQVAHASMMVCDDAEHQSDDYKAREFWKEEGMRKVVLKAPDLPTLNEYERKIQQLGIVTHKVVDFGLTQLEPNTITALGCEPLRIDSKKGIALAELTKELKLL